MNRCLIYFFLVCFELALSQSSQIDTHISWQFRKVGTTAFFPASVPGTVHTDLFANHLIKHPWLEQEKADPINTTHHTTMPSHCCARVDF